MRTIEQTSQFRRDFKREAKGQHRQALEAELSAVVEALASDATLEPRHRDHALTGDWKDHRDCHIKPDLVLIYRKPDQASVRILWILMLTDLSQTLTVFKRSISVIGCCGDSWKP